MSFWATSTGEQATGEIQETSFDPIPKGWYPAMFESVEIDEYEGQKKIKIKARVIDGEYKNRVLFLNLKAFEGPDIKDTARDRAVQMLVKMYQILNKGKLPSSEPDDRTLAVLSDKPLDIHIEVWNMKDRNGDPKSGNWLSNVAAKGEEVKAGGKPAPSRNAPPADDPRFSDAPF